MQYSYTVVVLTQAAMLIVLFIRVVQLDRVVARLKQRLDARQSFPERIKPKVETLLDALERTEQQRRASGATSAAPSHVRASKQREG